MTANLNKSALYRVIGPIIVAVMLLVAYAAWIAAPYLHSTVVRDAAVTAWAHAVTAPIDGTITFESRTIGSPIGESGIIAKIKNEHVSREQIDLAQLRLDLALAKKREAEQLLGEIEELENDRRKTKAHYADLFRSQLNARIAHYRTMITLNEERLVVMNAIAARKQDLASSGTGSVNEADEAMLRVVEVQIALDEMRGELSYLLRRKIAAEEGIFIEDSGDDPGWALADRMALKIEKKRLRESRRALEIEVLAAGQALERAKTNHLRLSEALVIAPSTGLLWRRMAVSGMSVSEGAPLAEWVDCNELLIDMPLSDAEAGLLTIGDRAEVILEGESRKRRGKVLLIRGAASPLDRKELAAIAKGRMDSLAHVLIALESTEADRKTCPIGRAAHVDLQGVGVLDIIFARLRV